jgi:hypothetical protein
MCTVSRKTSVATWLDVEGLMMTVLPADFSVSPSTAASMTVISSAVPKRFHQW